MWLKQLQFFQLTQYLNCSRDELAAKLQSLQFKPCMATMPFSMGWVSPVTEENDRLVRSIGDFQMLCLQIEEKILPATVIRQALTERIQLIESAENRKVYAKEKLALKDDIILTLMPRAFSKLTRVYAYIDIKKQWLVLGTTNAKKTEQFLAAFKKSVTEEVKPFEIKKLSPILTHWVLHQNYPDTFAVEKACVMQDARQTKRTIRCQQQDLFADTIRDFLKDHCLVKQIALSWHDRLQFVLADNFTLSAIKFTDALLAEAKETEAETQGQQFDADFYMMGGTFGPLLAELLELFAESQPLNGMATEKIAA